MGERCNSFQQAFDGWSLDWNAVFGLGFESAPPGWVTVYRECSADELARIAREGLLLSPDGRQHPDGQREMEFLDRFRPESVIKSGASRLHSVSVAPTLDSSRQARGRERAVLEMKVDPACGFVADADLIAPLLPFISDHADLIGRYSGIVRRYWEGLVSLSDFLDNYSRGSSPSGGWLRQTGADRALPQVFFTPEIILMTPVIGRQHIRIVRWESGTEGSEPAREWWNDNEEIWGEV